MTLKGNCSWNGSQLWSPQLVLILGIPQITLNILSLVSNGVVIIVILASHDLHHPIFMLFGNLALSDFLSSSSSLWISVLFLAHPDNTVWGSRDLLIPYALFATSILSTIYNLVSIGMERYLMVVGGGLRAPARVSKRKAMTVVLANWVLAVTLGSLPLLSWNGLDSGCQPSELYGPFCIDYLIFITIPHCVVALALPLFSYLNIVLVLRKQDAAMESHVGEGSRSAEVPVVRTSIAIWLLTLASYVPFFAGVLVDASGWHCPEDLYPGFFVFRNVTAIMITLNALGNPVLYTLKVKSLSSKFLLLFSGCSPNNQIQM
ncbi:lysophosphatidic acid receptor 1-A-like [Monodelphis domestica]|uniref:Lysophosphatidic acid receptor 1-A-like n=1 Tax=Monodelphis domestica TaxID=13616 RepID=H9H7V0_MONDO|nr:lysophosphatidic acid receptor 1-A-like [Monodelphis domestica]